MKPCLLLNSLNMGGLLCTYNNTKDGGLAENTNKSEITQNVVPRYLCTATKAAEADADYGFA